MTVTDGFARLLVTAGDDRTTVDLCWDSRLRALETSPLGPTLAGEELAASKMLALFTRAEARDFVDVFALARRYGFERPSRRSPPPPAPALPAVAEERQTAGSDPGVSRSEPTGFALRPNYWPKVASTARRNDAGSIAG